jgi:putative DNA primase/helicase
MNEVSAPEHAPVSHESAEREKAREAAEQAAREAYAARRANAMWDRAAPAGSHPYLTKKGIKPHGARVGEFWKENREGKAYLAAKNALLIPVKDCTRQIVGLQAIYAEPVKVGEELRGKDFVFGAKKVGCWATIGAPTEVAGQITIGICEGYATGASAHQATGLGVVVAFDAGNLLPVAREVRRLMPQARLVLLADNDQWTTRPNGDPWNPGVEKATDTARTVGGLFVVPAFTPDQVAAHEKREPTDWNDLHALAGLDEVRRQIMAVVDPQPEPEHFGPIEADPPIIQPDVLDADDYDMRERDMRPEPPPLRAEDYGEPAQIEFDGPANMAGKTAPPEPREEGEDEISENPFFRVLGHDRTHIYIYAHEKKMVTSRGEADWGEAALTGIAPLQWWELNFPADKGLNKKMALNWLQRTAFKRGYFDPDSMRGRGAWRDDGRVVFHFGHKLWVDGELIDVTKIDSSFIYEQGRRLRLPHEAPLSSAEGKKLFETFQLFAWSRPASAILLAGWCALAPVGGALRWRPHVWVTGSAGAGKSTILNFVHWLMCGTDIYAQGNSTEAGIRQTLRTDSRPVLFDESEQNNERETMRMQSVLSLIRQSSTESDAQTLKGTQGGDAMHFMIRSMFCLGSIQVGLKQQADIERMSVLSLRPKKEGTEAGAQAAENWKRISGGLAAIKADAELPAKLLHRSLKLLPITLQNVEVFAQAAAETFGSQRDGDQYGTLLAGAWSLVSTKVAALDDARAMIARYDWSDYLEGSETEESDKALSTLLGRLVRVDGRGDLSIGELVQRAARVDCETTDVQPDKAVAVLARYGIKIEWRGPINRWQDSALLVAHTHSELKELMASTPYAADLRGQLARLPGAATPRKSERFAGVTGLRTVHIPLRLVLGDLAR